MLRLHVLRPPCLENVIEMRALATLFDLEKTRDFVTRYVIYLVTSFVDYKRYRVLTRAALQTTTRENSKACTWSIGMVVAAGAGAAAAAAAAAVVVVVFAAVVAAAEDEELMI
jgi:hypothetical protein